MSTYNFDRINIVFVAFAILLLPSAVWATGTYDDGDGSQGNPFQINTPAQMDDIGQHSEDWGSYFILTADIDLFDYTGTAFNIIGSESTKFTGTFDGDSHKVWNFSFTWSSTGRAGIGLFGYVGSGGQIKNLGMENVNVNAGVGVYGVGGLVGEIELGTITNCYSSGIVSGAEEEIGGLIGGNQGGTVTDCYSTATVSGGSEAGGLVGYNPEGTITNCYATGSVSGNEQIGGLVGDNKMMITNCYATGSISGNLSVGGLAGNNSGTLSNCYATGNVSGDGDVGGLVGKDASGSYTSCFWDSTVNSVLTGIGNIADPPDVIAETTTNMKIETTFTNENWDFVSESANGSDNYWRLCTDGIKSPELAWQSITADLACPAGVDFGDFAFFASWWIEIDCDTSNDCGGSDMDLSTDVGLSDLQLFLGNWLADSL